MGGLVAIGKSKAKVYMKTDTKVTFSDAAGVDEAKEELKEVLNFSKIPRHMDVRVQKFQKGCCWSVRRVQEKLC